MHSEFVFKIAMGLSQVCIMMLFFEIVLGFCVFTLRIHLWSCFSRTYHINAAKSIDKRIVSLSKEPSFVADSTVDDGIGDPIAL